MSDSNVSQVAFLYNQKKEIFMKKDVEQIFKIFNNISSRMENEEEDVKLHSRENYSSLQIRHFWFYYISYLYIIIFTACVWIFKSKISLISPTSIYMYILLFLSIIAVILYIYIFTQVHQLF